MFPLVILRLLDVGDPVQGKTTIQVNGPRFGATISFWNKRDVSVYVLDKGSGENHLFDDRVLAADEDVTDLLKGYLARIETMLDTGGPA